VKDALKFPLLKFERGDLCTIAQAFARVIAQERYTCYACALMPDHVHLLIRKHKHLAEEMIENLQEESRAELLRVRLRPELHPVWGGQG
jgi:REP element-mobilizing transposase RayT